MNVSRLMALFHLAFVILGILSLLLIAGEIISFDWIALWIIVIAIAINAFFGILWLEEPSKKSIEKPVERPVVTLQIEHAFPMISLIASTYNEEPNISHFVKSLFNCAQNYRGPSEIIMIDDGSTDNTYESAWTTIDTLRKEMPNIHARILKHMTHMGRKETIRTGTNKAMGEFIILIDSTTPCDTTPLNNIIDAALSTKKEDRKPATPQTGMEPQPQIQLYPADQLRQLLASEEKTAPTSRN